MPGELAASASLWIPLTGVCSGTQDTQLSDTANAVLYALFAITGFFAGSINVSIDWGCTWATAEPALMERTEHAWPPLDSLPRYDRLLPLRRCPVVVSRRRVRIAVMRSNGSPRVATR